MLDLLSQGSKTVETLSNETEMSVANTSQHLQTLLELRIVKFQKRGTYAVYQLASEKVYSLVQSLQYVTEDRFAEINQLRKDFIERPDQLESINPETLLNRMKGGDITLIDVRPKSEFDTGHIPGALSMPINELNEQMTRLLKNKDIVAYCRGPYCVYATKAVEQLKSYGFNAVRLEAGIKEWKDIQENYTN